MFSLRLYTPLLKVAKIDDSTTKNYLLTLTSYSLVKGLHLNVTVPVRGEESETSGDLNQETRCLVSHFSSTDVNPTDPNCTTRQGEIYFLHLFNGESRR